MAPPKASFLFRIQNSGNFLGINWNLVNYKAPYTNNYPQTLFGGSTARRFSSPLFQGHFAHRTSRNNLRQCILAIPAGLFILQIIFNFDQYLFYKAYAMITNTKVSDEIEAWHAQEMADASWNKPGVMAKHHFGGMVSIPGSEKFVTEM